MSTNTPHAGAVPPVTRRPSDRTHYLYVAVIVAVALGILVGLVAPDLGVQLKSSSSRSARPSST
jgi:aerobic C4-dicarboxylate transport protein